VSASLSASANYVIMHRPACRLTVSVMSSSADVTECDVTSDAIKGTNLQTVGKESRYKLHVC